MKHPDTPIPTTLASSSVKITRRSVAFMSSDSFFLHVTLRDRSPHRAQRAGGGGGGPGTTTSGGAGAPTGGGTGAATTTWAGIHTQ